MSSSISSINRSSQIITCNAAVAWGPGEELVMEEVEVGPPQPLEIRVKVVCTSLCRSDITAWQSLATPSIFPRIFGHEASGIVESVGQGVTEFQKGLGAAWKVADISKQSTVVIFGLGTVGLSVAVGAKLRGASQIIGVDTNSEKFEKARSFGITQLVNPTDHEEPIHQVIKRMTSGGADYAFECVGDTGTVTNALLSCCDGWGVTVTLGVPKVEPEVRAHYGLFLSGRTLKGSLIGGWKPKSDIPKLVDMYIRKEIPVDQFITHNLRFADINQAFDLMNKGNCLRCVIHMPN
ncbi:alcohol dehydrogenase-like 6 isoform X6 [Beta vulgaris subsp. vulgaris]|uniref:alcohol dehydrogenase-like 6 isoform X6 n=1 Tax=Beta vulgaris subsp. vulgaris TaxID=3555 RepID=UPI002036F958|nr:alcohol dehydrogenase-like 6 isoform X6 [Beta vulgaris subsp. vulgaris]